jgi:predicted CXXCH cytochrome family protein
MRNLSLIILLAISFMVVSFTTDSPHGEKFKVSCNVCHSPSSWKIDKTIYSFDHNKTAMPLEGSHMETNCRSCHATLVFTDAKTACSDCHADIHENTTGPDCGRCHTPKSWIVENITALHRQSRFPLVGPHVTAECSQCHKSASLLRFEPLGIACFDCHQANYFATTKPNHAQSGFSVNCEECHSINSFDWNWNGSNIDHSFFPLSAGHAIADCKRCHTNGTYSNISRECSSCHLANYNQTTNPNHLSAQFPTTCYQCHTTNPDWKPATFNHTNFPLTSGHALTDCNQCHINGNYTNTSTECVSCHLANYNQTTDPNHVSAQYPTTCGECHTTNPGWKPATFNHTNFPLTNGHAITDCNQCHINGNYTNTSTECVSCHQANYNQTTNPKHSAANISTDCASCHTTNPGWKPASFAIHDTFFPIYSGKHRGQWNTCDECHTNLADYSVFTCTNCHAHNQTDMNNHHNGVNGYSWNSTACYQCHPTGNSDK